MFLKTRRQTRLFGAVQIAELIYHALVRNVRKRHNNAVMAILLNMLQIVVFVMVFYVLFVILGLRGTAVRGDFLLYVMSGIFLFICHTKAVAAVAGAEGPNSAMMQHAPMNTIVAISAAALGSLYVQTLSMLAILYIYHIGFTPIEIDQPAAAYGMLLLSWFTGCAVGLIFLVLKPWFPVVVGILVTIYQRANMIASGKMFLANTLPGYMLAMFDWNPLFHNIDQARGFVFINYNPHFSSWHYAWWVGVVLIVIGLIGEFYTRRHVSLSWSARR
jgi:ABC-type polysaccharide/polyol phosphate export permease